MNKYLERFIDSLDVEQGYALNTVKTYRWILKDFLEFIDGKKIKLKKLKRETILEYILYLREGRKNCSRTIRLKLYALRSFLKHLTEDMNVSAQINSPFFAHLITPSSFFQNKDKTLSVGKKTESSRD